ncbi:hypothetical protein F5148DRAFT_1165697 [Russula earlei]|uniref:Uncharacterized protein n=1 Tax=Russula earlei TaxID=71964 RepID=A0ACC0UK50_9AGAM|nr:hypothetical protein F5148DRAFT_1165697 [Russula earlei]
MTRPFSLLSITMKSSLSWAIATAFIAFGLWRNGRSSRNILIPTPDFPHGYYAEGSHNEHCAIVRDTPSNDMKFCEDAVFWEQQDRSGAVLDKVLLLSCDPSRRGWNTVMGPMLEPSFRGALWYYTIGQGGGASGRPRRITLEGYPEEHNFHPLGLDVYPSQPDRPESNLFVVNHARYNSTVEQFVISWRSPDRARWVRTLSGPEFVSPNALALTGPTSFYLTNDHRFTRRLPGVLGKTLPLAETILGLPLAWTNHVTLSDASTNEDAPGSPYAEVVTSRLAFPNGVAVSADGAQVAIASTTLCEILFYARDPATQALSPLARVPTPFAPDNVRFDSQGSLIVAGHPHFQSLVAVAANRTDALAPSWVVSITPTSPAAEAETKMGSDWDLGVPVPASRKVPRAPGYELRTLYQSDGSEFSSSSTALRDARTGVLYVVGLYADGLMVCTP